MPGGYLPSERFVKWFGKPAAPPPTQHAPPEHRGLGRSSFGVFFLTTLIQVLGVISSAAVGHTFGYRAATATTPSGVAIWGELVFFLLIASSINWLGDLRVGSAYTYYVSRGQPAKELTGTYLGLRLILVSLIGIATLPLTYLLGGSFGFSLSGTTYVSFGLFLVLPILWTPWMVVSQLRIARGSSIQAQYPQLVEIGVRTSVIIAVIYLDPGLLGFTFAFVLGGLASFLYCLPELWREMSPPARARAVQLLRYSWPLMGSLMFQFLASNAPPFFVTGLLRSTALFGVFSWDNGWRILLLSVPSAVVLPLFPYLASFHAKGEYALVQRKTWEALRFTAIIVVPFAIAIVVYRVPIPNDLYDGFYARQGAIALPLLALSAIPLGLSQVIGTSLNSIGYQRLELYISGTIVGAMVVSTVTLYELFPSLGAIAAGVLVGSLAALALNTYFMEHLLHVRIRPVPIVRIVAAAGAAFLIMAELNKFVNPTKWTLIPLLLLGLVVYAFVLAAIGELTKADLKTITTAIGLPERLAIVLGRLCWRAEPTP
ncbi:MAG: polysaccharide biosynthesis C-terminal domain-containing protein [Thermoplasmata archaeon]|nr:polysaccharide biosynthesis C-terminal domain-containing protein [Thermoplasmata archaeon]